MMLPHQYYLYKVQSYIFYKLFLISPILYDGSTLVNFGFLIKQDFLYVTSILDFTGLKVCIIFIGIQNFSWIYEIP